MTTLEKVGIGMGGFALVGIVWTYVKIVLGWCMRFLVTTEFLYHNESHGHNVLSTYFEHAYPMNLMSPTFVSRAYDMRTLWVRPRQASIPVAFISNQLSPWVRFVRGRWGIRWPLMMKPDTTIAEEGAGGRSFSYIRGTIDWADLVAKATDHWTDTCEENRNVGRLRHYVRKHVGELASTIQLIEKKDAMEAKPNFACRMDVELQGLAPLNWEWDDLFREVESKSMEQFSLTPETARVVERVRFWNGSKDWYAERGITWKLAYLLEGNPGTGKTSLVRAISESEDVPVHIFDIGSATNQNLTDWVMEARKDAPAIVLIEDVDAVFEGRKNVSPGSLTFDHLLNCLDGVERADGLLMFVTTNHIDKVDWALGGPMGAEKQQKSDTDMPKRPGRIDDVVHFGPMDRAGLEKIGRRILPEYPSVVDELLETGISDTPAQFTERCIRAALAKKWEAV